MSSVSHDQIYKQCSFVILSDVRKMLIPSYLLALSMCIKKGYSFRVFDQLSRKIIFDSSRFRTSRILRAQVFHKMVNVAQSFSVQKWPESNF